MVTGSSERQVWFAMRVTYRRELVVRSKLEDRGVECYIPMHWRRSVRTGKKELVPVIHNLIFVHILPSAMKEIKKDVSMSCLQYMTDSRSGEKIIVPDGQMKQFIAVSGTYDDTLKFFGPGEVDLSKGQKVRVTGGIFAGCEGVFVKVRGIRAKKVVIQITGVVAVALISVHPDLVEPLGQISDSK